MTQRQFDTIHVGVMGGSGYTGGELLRLLYNHPHANIRWATSRGDDELERVHPHLRRTDLKFWKPGDVDEKIDLAFLCLPSGEAMIPAPKFLERGARVIDLSPDFRFKDPETYKRVYGKEHIAPELCKEAAYGITEINRDEIRKARLVANPGCYVITSLLGMWPLIRAGWIDVDNIHIDAVNGTSGGKGLIHTQLAESNSHYSHNRHRHTDELEDQVQRLSGATKSRVVLSTRHGNFTRGVDAIISAPYVGLHGTSREELTGIYQLCYEDEFFVRINDLPRTVEGTGKDYDIYPRVNQVKGSNFCDIGLDYDPISKTVKIVAVTDNLVKGAAGSAIQNMNVMFGYDEKTGLEQLPTYP